MTIFGSAEKVFVSWDHRLSVEDLPSLEPWAGNGVHLTHLGNPILADGELWIRPGDIEIHDDPRSLPDIAKSLARNIDISAVALHPRGVSLWKTRVAVASAMRLFREEPTRAGDGPVITCAAHPELLDLRAFRGFRLHYHRVEIVHFGGLMTRSGLWELRRNGTENSRPELWFR
ncbi:hypothetical protein [Frankia sp. R82]|uniref:hypothetical protein n=1 Tax=Frankia sp. R82 TaxID=2950553 RepID=UPI0020430107|nr:hypothetical protein [Frankia sp. R82]MCM3882139.1 hypothetical protein [Frankia sp. R82]